MLLKGLVSPEDKKSTRPFSLVSRGYSMMSNAGIKSKPKAKKKAKKNKKSLKK